MPKKRPSAKKRVEKKKNKSKASLPKELHGIPLVAISLLFLLSLLSFKQGLPHSNWLGLVGYGIAYALNYVLGISSYILVAFIGWTGGRLMLAKPLEFMRFKIVYFTILLFSCSILFNLFAETYPKVAANFDKGIITQTVELQTPVVYKKIRYYLGGIPTYALYCDLPLVSLQHLLSNVGTFLVFFTTLSVAILQLAKTRLAAWFTQLLDKLAEEKGEEDEREGKTPLFAMDVPPLPSFSKEIKNPFLNPAPLPFKKAPIIEVFDDGDIEVEDEWDAPPPPKQPAKLKIKEPSLELKLPKRDMALQAQAIVNGDYTKYQLPPLSLLQDAKKFDQSSLKKDLKTQAEILEETLMSFGIEAKVGHIQCGPTITSFEVHPAIGVKVQKIKSLENDIALNLKAKSIRIIAPIPGKAAVGVEVPNPLPQEVSFKEMMANYQSGQRKYQIPILLGKIVNGDDLSTDLAKMPHGIIAGATGSGKSVCINTIVMTIVMNARPDEIKLLMIDPKKVELTAYSNLPHMIAPVITEPHGAAAALNWLVKEMERRYELLKQAGMRNIIGFNLRDKSRDPEENEFPEKLSYIVAIIDELADLMMVSSSDIETPIARIAQMARAVGIHLILATQRPSREVITGLIKANFPTRIAFKVASRVNSQIILDEVGAESLLGNGDMLFLPPGSSSLTRAQGAFIRDEDIYRVVEFICNQAPANYLIPSFDTMNYSDATSGIKDTSQLDSLYDQALNIVIETGNASTTFLQRKLKIGYARAASVMDQLHENGIIGPQEGAKPRKVLHTKRPSEDALVDEEV
ncbi:MAG: DNA translocase FtsK 4TM domain-containing protein [Parachlamydiales bacterium]|nr:DNA translocase FtsK 4TM domain-containing protein [Parachlamydiales bacterium]